MPDGSNEEYVKLVENSGELLLNEIDADIGIEHDLQENGRVRFCATGCLRPFSMKPFGNFPKLSARRDHDFFFGRRTSVAPLCSSSISSPST